MEHRESLCPGGLQLLWDDTLFSPGTDSFLLSSLPRLKSGMKVCDLGSGTGLLGLLLLQRSRDLSVTGVELLDRAAALADRCAAENGLRDRLTTIRGDLRDIRSLLPANGFDLAISNPPYFPPGSGALAPESERQTARAEVSCSVDDLCAAAAWLLRWGGSFCLVHRPERLTDLLCALRAHALEPKRLRTVQLRPEAKPSLILIEARRGGKPGLSLDAPLILQTADGSPTEELDRIYFRLEEDRP